MELVTGALAVVVHGRNLESIIRVQESGLLTVVSPDASTKRKMEDM